MLDYTASSNPAKFIINEEFAMEKGSKKFELIHYTQFFEDYTLELKVLNKEDLQYLINKNYHGSLNGCIYFSADNVKYFTKNWLIKNMSVKYYGGSDNINYYTVEITLNKTDSWKDRYYHIKEVISNKRAELSNSKCDEVCSSQKLFEKTQKIPTTMDDYCNAYNPKWDEFKQVNFDGIWSEVFKDWNNFNEERKNKMVKIKDIFVNKEKQTIVIKWENGETTKVTCDPADKWDLEKGVAIAIAKFYLGNNYNGGELFKRYLKKAEKSEEIAEKKAKKKVVRKVKKDEAKSK